MDISYLGHSAFKLKGKEAVVVCDPFDKKVVGFSMAQASADIVTVSHDHQDHNTVKNVSGTSRRQPYIISAPGEYEINGVGIFGWRSYHDDTQQLTNTIYSIIIDGIRVVHTGDLGHIITEEQVEGLGKVDVLLIPVGGKSTLGAKDAMAVVEKLSPSIVIPMHYKTPEHNAENFGDLTDAGEFLKLMGGTDVQPLEKLKITPDSLPAEPQVILLSRVSK